MNEPIRRNDLGEARTAFAPRWLRRVCYSLIAVVVVGTGVIMVNAPGTENGYQQPDLMGWAGTALFLCIILWRFGGTKITVHANGLNIRNFFRSYFLLWPQILSVDFYPEESFAILETTTGNQISIIALGKSEGARAYQFCSQVRQHLAHYDSGNQESN